MQRVVIQRILGLLLMIFSISMLPPLLVGYYYNEADVLDIFGVAFFATLVTGFVLWMPTRKQYAEMRLRDGFIVVVMFWTVLGVFGTLPFLLSDEVQISFIDSLFE